MKRDSFSLAQFLPLLFGLTFLSAASALAEAPEVRRIEQAFFAGNVTHVEVDVTLASLEVIGVSDGRQAEVEVSLTCARKDNAKCLRRAERIRLVPRLRGDKMALRLKGTPRGQAGGIEAHMKLRIPDRVSLEIDVAGGEVVVHKMMHHVEIDSGGGNIEFVGSQDKVGIFKVDVGFGRGTLWLRDSKIEASGWPRSINWQGSGVAKVEIDLGGGEIKARLD